MLNLIIAVLIVLMFSALFSMIEAAIFSLPVSKARQMGEQSKNGRIVQKIRENPARPISTIVIGNNISNIVGTYFVAFLATKTLTGLSATWFPFLLTALIILFAEIVPKTIGERFCVRITTFASRPLLWVTWLLTPLVYLIERFTSLFTRGDPVLVTSEQEIRALSRIAHQAGIIDEDESQMIGKVFELDDATAESIMTPRTAMTWIRGIEPIKVAAEQIAHCQHSRIVVVGETLDDIKGIILKSTMLRLLVDVVDENTCVEDHTEPVKMFKESTPADELLAYFKQSCVHLAIVIDEYGGVSGIVTLEDVLEVLTGEIVDETDTCTDMREIALQNGILRLTEQGEKGDIESRTTSSRRVREIGSGSSDRTPIRTSTGS